ncbi:hypothetical protein NMG60_11034443 [Bertholletia excelsa]
MASSSLVASQSLNLRSPSSLSPRSPSSLSIPSLPKQCLLNSCKPRTQSLSLSLRSRKPCSLASRNSRVFASASPAIVPENHPISSSNASQSPLAGSTRTIATIVAVTLSVSRLVASKICSFALKLKGICTNPTPEELAVIQNVQESLVCTVGPLFFAALKDRPSGYLNTPLTVVASGMAKWLDIYSGVLMVRVLLSWFPNIPWDRQPLSAIRDLCDPYLNLFRNIIPPIFDTLDVSPLLAFALLGTLGSILNSSRAAY